MFKNSIIILLCLFLISCKKDEDQTPIPNNDNVVVQTISSQNIPDGGVTLKGRVRGVELDLNFGFIISPVEGDTLPFSFNLSKFKSGLYNGDYQINFLDDLIDGNTYYYRAVAYTDNKYIYGEEKSFISNGSSLPIIEYVLPNIAHTEDTITIKGKNFSNQPRVLFDDIYSTIISKKDTLIKCIVPYTHLNSPFTKIKVKKQTSEEVVYNDFSLYTPIVDSITPSIAYETDTLTIHGNHFHKEYLRNELLVEIIGEYYPVEVIESSRTKIVFKNTGSYYDLHPKFKLKCQYQTIEFDDKLTALMPTITKVPSCISFDKKATIYGENFPTFNFTIYIGGMDFSTQSVSRDSIVLNVDKDDLYSDFNLQNVMIKFLGNNIVYEADICISEPWIVVSHVTPSITNNYNGEIYAFIGQSIGKFNESTYNFESINNTIVPLEMYGPTLLKTIIGPKLYSYNGYSLTDNTILSNNFRSFDFLKDELVELFPFPGGSRLNGLMEVVGDYIYFGLGSNENIKMVYSDIWKYSLINNTWEFVMNFPDIVNSSNAIIDPITFVIGNSIFIGANQGGNNSSFWEFNTIDNSINKRAAIPTTFTVFSGNHASNTMNGKGYIEDNYLFEYDPENNTWHIYNNIISIRNSFERNPQNIFSYNNILYRSYNDGYTNSGKLLKLNTKYLIK